MKKLKEEKENETRLRKTNGFEVRYVTARNPDGYGECAIGKGGVVNIIGDEYNISCDNKTIFSHSLKGLQGSELMSLDGIILSYTDDKTGEYVEIIAYYKYYRDKCL